MARAPEDMTNKERLHNLGLFSDTDMKTECRSTVMGDRKRHKNMTYYRKRENSLVSMSM